MPDDFETLRADIPVEAADRVSCVSAVLLLGLAVREALSALEMC